MSASTGEVSVIDLAKCPTPQALADAIRLPLSSLGFLYVLNHGMEEDVARMFRISGKARDKLCDTELTLPQRRSSRRRPRLRRNAAATCVVPVRWRRTYKAETSCVKDNNKGYTRVRQEV